MLLVQALKVQGGRLCPQPPQALEGMLASPVDIQESTWT